ncbi:MAG: hypothetical protein FWC55_04165 [Firmicutes bacterium]|nr:hypothetical protein [Bacillota bacterium]
MFSDLNSLNYEDFIVVCHGIFAAWNGSVSLLYSMSPRLRKAVEIFVEKHSMRQYKQSLIEYIDERVLTESQISDDSRIAGDNFLRTIADDLDMTVDWYLNTVTERRRRLSREHNPMSMLESLKASKL